MKEKNEEEKTEKKSKVFKILIIVLLIILAILIIAGIIGISYVYSKLFKINYIELNEEDIEINEGVKELTGYRNIALFGIDTRNNEYNNTRSDTIIIASINQETSEVKLVSVYRDTYLSIDGHGLDKATHAYAYGGPKLAINTLNKNLDLDIKEFVTVNFNAVIDIVNEIGGIEITVEKDEVQHLNKYVQDMHDEMGTPNTKIKSAGKQTLNGVQALAYSRIRYTEGGDYKRSERTRTLLTTVFNKVKRLNIGELNKLADIVLPKIYTNMNTGDILGLVPQVTKFSIGESAGWPEETKGATIGGVWYGVPVTLESSVTKLHKEVFKEEDYEPSSTLKEISNKIITKSGYKN